MTKPEPLMSTSAAALRLGICERQVRQLISDGELPVVKLGKSARGYRLNPSDIESYIKKVTVIIREEKAWQSISAAKRGTQISDTKVNELDALLGRNPKERQKSANEKSAPKLNRKAANS